MYSSGSELSEGPGGGGGAKKKKKDVFPGHSGTFQVFSNRPIGEAVLGA